MALLEKAQVVLLDRKELKEIVDEFAWDMGTKPFTLNYINPEPLKGIVIREANAQGFTKESNFNSFNSQLRLAAAAAECGIINTARLARKEISIAIEEYLISKRPGNLEDKVLAVLPPSHDPNEVQKIQSTSMMERTEQQENQNQYRNFSASIEPDIPTDTSDTGLPISNSDDSDTASSIHNGVIASTGTELSTAFDPLPLSNIAKMFPQDKDDQRNLKKWKSWSSNASRNGLINARITIGKGRAESTYNPWMVSDWLVLNKDLTRVKAKYKLANNLPYRSIHLKELILS